MTTAQIISPRYNEQDPSEMEITGFVVFSASSDGAEKKVLSSMGEGIQIYVGGFCDAGPRKATRKINEAIGEVDFLVRQGPVIVLSLKDHSTWGTRLAHPTRHAVSAFRDLSNVDETRVTFMLYPQDLPKDAMLEARPVMRKLQPNEILFVKGPVRMRIEVPAKGSFVWQGNSGKPMGLDMFGPEVFEFMVGLPIGVAEAQEVKLSKDAPLSEWPGVRGISGYDEGNYITVLFLAWAYILSAKWVELLDRSEAHQCSTEYSPKARQGPKEPEIEVIEVDLPPDASEAEIVWWNAILSGTPAWDISMEYESDKFISPCLPIPHPLLQPPPHLRTMHSSTISIIFHPRRLPPQDTDPPNPKPTKNVTYHSPTSSQSISSLISEHENLLPYYMTLSSKMCMTTIPAMKSIFFNADIPCNLVSAWTNAIFAVINPIVKQGDIPRLLNGLSARGPRVASLWLGTAIMGTSSIYLKHSEQGLIAPVLEAEAWMGVRTTFLTQPPRIYDKDAEFVQRDDECRLLLLATPSDGEYNHGYVTVWPWKPFGRARVCETDILLREHLSCGCHVLEYEGWSWELGDGSRVEDTGVGARFSPLLSTSNYSSKAATVSRS
ncbi:uncharacterized protein PGRI_053440 [Penicillium griseofulvum]|uniref:Uncharacterized protein n=1 Tax=Penicillium patulum TaxID=5078 RepID=A0A135LBY9_PENPA|nr:uncharacterized protein PGRI_053440 [Penicillium griseofulvum]KXG46488.1 hypothetical protein PGRI_053440 [Penicillium griseofulvum]